MINIISSRETSDGSHTLHSSLFDATYHSMHGALQESMHIYIKNGLMRKTSLTKISLLELGFGSGLNAILTYTAALTEGLSVAYDTLEAYALDEQTIRDLHFGNILDRHQIDILHRMHDLSWNEEHALSPHFTFQKCHTHFEDYSPSKEYDIIYHDAFAPSATPAYWEQPFVGHLASLLRPEGFIISFCTKGTYRRALEAAGLKVEKLKGPKGKREISRAWKN